MPAPDLPPAIPHTRAQRPTSVHLLPGLAAQSDLRGAVVIMIDALRASTTIAAALHAGAASVVPTLTVQHALERAAAMSPRPLLGGERAGQIIPGFDLGNSPRDYTPMALAGRHVVFTTTNGTAAMLHAAKADAAEIIVGSFANLTAVIDHTAQDPRPLSLLCAGTRDAVTLDDALAAGAMIERLLAAGRSLTQDDSPRLCLAAWHLAQEDLTAAMLASRGGRNLAAINLAQDVADCATIDAFPVLPRFDPVTGTITA